MADNTNIINQVPELFYGEQQEYTDAIKKPNGIYFTSDTHKIYVGEDDFSNPLVKNKDGELTPLHVSNKEFQEHVDEFNSYKTQVTEDIKAVETQLDYIKNTPGVKPLPDSSNDLLQLPIGNYTCLSAQGQSVYMDCWDEEIQGSRWIHYELEYGNTVSIYKYSNGVDAEKDAIWYKIRTFKEHIDITTDLGRSEVKSIEVNELEHVYSIDHLDLTISEVEEILRECHTNHKPLVIVKGRMRYLCNQVHLLGTNDQYLVFIFTNYDGNGLATVYRNQYLRDTTSSDRSILATAEQTPYTIQFTKGTSTDTPK